MAARPSLLLAATLAACLTTLLLPGAGALAQQSDDERWQMLRSGLFGERPIHDAAGVVELQAPERAHDAAIVPVSVSAAFEQTAERYIRTITLIADKNPAPVIGTFKLSPANGIASIDTRIRVNEYTNVRAVVETNDGELYMASRFVKASGGCSAPAGKDADAALARLGRMKLLQPAAGETQAEAQLRVAQLLISHPNHTGMQMDQLTRHYVPARFVREIKVSYGDEPILTVESSISLSEDPSIHFRYRPDQRHEITVEVTDSEEQTFTGSFTVAPATGT